MLSFADSNYLGIAIYRDKIDCDDYFIKELASGLHELQFKISIYNPAYKYIAEESRIFEDRWNGADQCFVVKAIDAGEKHATMKCQYDLDDWKGNVYWDFALDDTFANIVNHVLPDGWTLVNNSGDVTTHLLELDACTRFEVVMKCDELWPDLTALFNNYTKVVTIVNKKNGTNYGAMVARDLNLRKLTYKGKSTDFATRVFPLGKDGLKITDVNQGSEYVEDTTYSSKIICAHMIDTSIEDANELKAAAEKALEEISVPRRSYSCDIVDIAAALPQQYAWLDMHLFDKVMIIDDTKYNGRLTYSVVERTVYPYMPNKNRVVLSSTAPRIQNQVRSVSAKVAEEAGNMVQQITDIAASLISSLLSDGNIRILDTNNDGKIDTIYVADNVNPASAQNVIRIDSTGIARSTTGYSGQFTYGEVWSTSRWAIRGEALPMSFSAVNYVPTTLTYKDGNGTNQTITVLAEQGNVLEEPIDDPFILE